MEFSNLKLYTLFEMLEFKALPSQSFIDYQNTSQLTIIITGWEHIEC